MLACVRLLAQRRTASIRRRERLDLRRLQQAVASAGARMPMTSTAAARVAARAAFRAAADALQAHHHHRAQQPLERAQALELMFFEKPTHYFHARCDPRHFSDTRLTYVSDPATGAVVTLDTPDGSPTRSASQHHQQHRETENDRMELLNVDH